MLPKFLGCELSVHRNNVLTKIDDNATYNTRKDTGDELLNTSWLVSWSLTSLFSTNMAISETS